MHKDNAQAFWVVGLKDLDHEFHRTIVLITGSVKALCNQEKPSHTMFAMEKSVMSNTIA